VISLFRARNAAEKVSHFPVPTFAQPRNVASSLTASRGASMSPRSVQLAWSSQRSVTKILPSNRPSHLHRFRPDLTAYARVLADRERSGGIDCALHLAVDEQLVQEFNRAFNRNSSGEKSAGWRWHERAAGWPLDDRWVWPIRLRGLSPPARSKAGKRLHGENCAESFGILEAK
jgi:hypothetical protein